MKKIIALLCIFAMAFSMMAITANAEDSYKLYWVEEGDYYVLKFDTTKDISTAKFYINITDALAAGLTVSDGSSPAGFTANFTQKPTFPASLKGSTIIGLVYSATANLTAGTIDVAKCKIDDSALAEGSSVALSKVSVSNPVVWNVKAADGSNITDAIVYEELVFSKEAAGGDEEEKVVMTAEPFFTAVAESAENNGWQKGQAVALQFKTADLAEFVAMNWKLTVEGLGDRFAKVDDAAFATIQATDAETVDVFASFIVNTAENAEATPITAVSAGFKKADGTVVEAE